MTSLTTTIHIQSRFINTINSIYAEAHHSGQPHSYILDRIQREVSEPANAYKRPLPQWVHSSLSAASQALLAHVFNTQLVWVHKDSLGKLYTTNRKYIGVYLDANVHIYGTNSDPLTSRDIGHNQNGWSSHHVWAGTDKEFS